MKKFIEACVACEDKPAPGNNPCGWCGRTTPPSEGRYSSERSPAMTANNLGVKRYELESGHDSMMRRVNRMRESEDGVYVRFDDYEALQAENERLRKDVERYRWIRDGGWLLIGEDRGNGPEWPPAETVDVLVDRAIAKAIDAARRIEGGNHE